MKHSSLLVAAALFLASCTSSLPLEEAIDAALAMEPRAVLTSASYHARPRSTGQVIQDTRDDPAPPPSSITEREFRHIGLVDEEHLISLVLDRDGTLVRERRTRPPRRLHRALARFLERWRASDAIPPRRALDLATHSNPEALLVGLTMDTQGMKLLLLEENTLEQVTLTPQGHILSRTPIADEDTFFDVGTDEVE